MSAKPRGQKTKFQDNVKAVEGPFSRHSTVLDNVIDNIIIITSTLTRKSYLIAWKHFVHADERTDDDDDFEIFDLPSGSRNQSAV